MLFSISVHLNLHPAVRTQVWRDGGQSPWYSPKANPPELHLGIQILTLATLCLPPTAVSDTYTLLEQPYWLFENSVNLHQFTIFRIVNLRRFSLRFHRMRFIPPMGTAWPLLCEDCLIHSRSMSIPLDLWFIPGR